MPIYAYRCADCGHTKDVLQKMSDAPLSQCPACGATSFHKQVTAAGFQLKGSGWYVTDFRGGNGAAKKAEAAGHDKPADKADQPASTPAAAADATPAARDKAAPAASPAPAPAPGAGKSAA